MWSGVPGGGKSTRSAGTVMYDWVIAFPESVIYVLQVASLVPDVPARMNEKVMQVPAMALTIVLSDILV